MMEKLYENKIAEYLSLKQGYSAIYKKNKLVWQKGTLINKNSGLTELLGIETDEIIDAENITAYPCKICGKNFMADITYMNSDDSSDGLIILELMDDINVKEFVKSTDYYDVINRSLSTIYSYTSKLYDLTNIPSDAFDKEYVTNKISSSVSNIYYNINNVQRLLDFNTPIHEPKVFDVKEAVEEICESCNSALAESERKIELKYLGKDEFEEQNSLIKCHYSDFKILLLNLIRNAFLFSPHTKNIEVVYEVKPKTVEISINNNRLKEDNSTDEKIGIGLEIVEMITEKYRFKHKVDNGKLKIKHMLTIPLLYDVTSDYSLNSSMREYVFDKKSMIEMYMSEVINSEQEEKMYKKKRKWRGKNV